METQQTEVYISREFLALLTNNEIRYLLGLPLVEEEQPEGLATKLIRLP